MSGDPGWNSIIHHSSQLELQSWGDWDGNGENDQELPSTVDMDAIKDGSTWNPMAGQNGVSEDNSDDDSDSDDDSSNNSDGSGSYSDSNSESDNDSSDSESNSEYTSEHSEPSNQFAIRETNFEQGGLKLKISMKLPKKEDYEKNRYERNKQRMWVRRTKSRAAKLSDESSNESDSSNSRSSDQYSQPQIIQNPSYANIPTEEPQQPLPEHLKEKSQKSLPLTQDQQQPVLQEINQADLAAILPDQQNDDAPFDGFEESENGGLVSKAIERIAVGGDSDSNERNSVPVYSSSLLQQFAEKTNQLTEPRKRRNRLTATKKENTESNTPSNVSPDSGIQSVDNSPMHLVSPASPPTTSASSVTPAAIVPTQMQPPAQTVVLEAASLPTSSPKKRGRPAKNHSKQPVQSKSKTPGRPRRLETVKSPLKSINVGLKKAKVMVTPCQEPKRGPKTQVKPGVVQETKGLGGRKRTKVFPIREVVTSKRRRQEKKVIKEPKKELPNRKTKQVSSRNLKKQQPIPKKVLKENKSPKKFNNIQTNGVGVQTMISLPVSSPEKRSSEANCKKKHHKKRKRLPKIDLQIDPVAEQELEKLVEEFSKCCSLGKPGKKRKAAELSGSEDKQQKRRATKKEKSSQANGTSNPNEQRLPLKKRHYQIFSTDSLGGESEGEDLSGEEEEAAKAAGVEEQKHIEEAIEATVTKYGGEEINKDKKLSKEQKIVDKIAEKLEKNKAVREQKIAEANNKHFEIAKELVAKTETQPRRKKKIVKDLRVTVTKLPEENIEKIEKPEKIGKVAKKAEKAALKSQPAPELTMRTRKKDRKTELSSSITKEVEVKLTVEKELKKTKLVEEPKESKKDVKILAKKEKEVETEKSISEIEAAPIEVKRTPRSQKREEIVEMVKLISTPQSHKKEEVLESSKLTLTPRSQKKEEVLETSILASTPRSHKKEEVSETSRLVLTPRSHKKEGLLEAPKLISTSRSHKKEEILETPKLTSTPRSHKKEENSETPKSTSTPRANKKEGNLDASKSASDIEVKKTARNQKKMESLENSIPIEPMLDKDKIVECLQNIETASEMSIETECSQSTTSTTPTPRKSGIAVVLKRKVKKRRAPNRTGFPTIKKKKKKPVASTDTSTVDLTDDSKTTSIDKKNGESAEVEKLDIPITEEKVSEKVELVKKTEPEISNKKKEIEIFDFHEELEEKFEMKKKSDTLSLKTNATTGSEKRKKSSSKAQAKKLLKNEDTIEAPKGQIRVRRDLLASTKSKTCNDSCSIDHNSMHDSKIFDENATLEESLERYNRSQKIAELSRENVRKLENANSQLKLDLVGCLNNNHHRRTRNSSSPCNLTLKSIQRLKNTAENYDTESAPSSDIASEDHDNKATTTTNRTGKKKQPRWKKRYLTAGLFSDCFKEDEPSKAKTGNSKLVYDPADFPHGLLPPPSHCGKFLRQKKIHFQLPYDLWWLHTHSKLPGRDVVPSWNYRKIRSNVYYDVKPIMLYESQACECLASANCGDECINKMCFSECTPNLCPCGERCQNQKIQRHEWAPGITRFMTKSKGWGIKTNKQIKSGDFILEYVGEVVSEKEFKNRMATRYASDTHHYCLNLDSGLVIDGHRMGGDGRFVNHSCEPNCEMQKWSVNGLPRMALFASRDIKPGEELNYDYNFALFNPSEGQECRCGSEQCRGVIGGKSQRVIRVKPNESADQADDKKGAGRSKKGRKANEPTLSKKNRKSMCKTRKPGGMALALALAAIKSLSYGQRTFVRDHRCFLIRNFEKVRRHRAPGTSLGQGKANGDQSLGKERSNDVKESELFFSQLTALTSTRTVKTRKLAQAEDHPEVSKAAKLAKVLKDLYNVITTAKDENDALICTPFMTLPLKKKLPEFYEKIADPIDLSTIDQGIASAQYKSADLFDQDVIRLFENYVKFYGRGSEIGIAAAKLRKIYVDSKGDFVTALVEATGQPPSQSFLPTKGATTTIEEEDIIRCICGLYRDEGLMIQCEKCLVWQHCDCVKADTNASYQCEKCQPREVDLEIPVENEEPEEGKRYFVTLLRDDGLQLRQGDTVYVLRDTPEKHTYKTIGDLDHEQMDIFRIERLYKNDKGERFVFGHHYLRPHETFHEPSRKFFNNEVLCSPLYEAIAIDLVADRCWVLDPFTFGKGRPVGSIPEHIYICELRVDKAARMFSKISRTRHQTCLKPYAFEMYPQRIKFSRTYMPHSLDGLSTSKKSGKEKKNPELDTSLSKIYPSKRVVLKGKRKRSKSSGHKKSIQNSPTAPVKPVRRVKSREERKGRLNNVLLKLLDKMPNKAEPLDATGVLERNRRNRKRPGILNP